MTSGVFLVSWKDNWGAKFSELFEIREGHDQVLKGLGNIVQMRDSSDKVVTSILDVQLKII